MKTTELQKRIDYRKVLSLVVAMLLMVVGYQAIQYKKDANFNKLQITVQKNNGDRSLLTKAAVMKLMREHLGFDPAAANIDEVNFRELEESLEENPYIQEVLIYVNSRHEMIVVVKERKPIARVKAHDVDYYIATDGTRIPLSHFSTIRVPMITGYVGFISKKNKGSRKRYKRLVDLMNTCNNDEFLTALIEQIDIDIKGKLTFIPKIGKERIVFGAIEDEAEKLDKLKKYYQWGRNQDGWDKYAYLNLEIKNQIALGK